MSQNTRDSGTITVNNYGTRKFQKEKFYHEIYTVVTNLKNEGDAHCIFS